MTVLGISHKLWLFGISILHPQVEFLKTTTVRTLLDTHRNQGIISVLLSVKGQAQPEAIRRHLQVKTPKLTSGVLRGTVISQILFKQFLNDLYGTKFPHLLL